MHSIEHLKCQYHVAFAKTERQNALAFLVRATGASEGIWGQAFFYDI